MNAIKTEFPAATRCGRGRMLAAAAGLAVLTFALFAPALRYGFAELDDTLYVEQNAVVQQGLTGTGLRQVFSQPYAAMYAPLLWTSYMLDVECFGYDVWGFHFTNLLLHAVNAGLFFLLLFAWSRQPWRAFFFAALWAWHPLRIESVAWIAERKDVLSGFFFLLCIGAYHVARRNSAAPGPAPGPSPRARNGFFLASLLWLACGLLVKPALVPVPGVLLLLDFWPYRRFDLSRAALARRLPRLLLEKIPFVLLAAAAAGTATWAHHASEAIAEISWLARLKTIPIHYGFYLFKMFRPRNLTALYPDVLFSRHDFFVALALLTAVSTLVWLSRRRQPNELVGWLWFLGLLAPVIGFVHFGVQTVADRFTYLPAMGASLALLFVLPTRPTAVFRRWIRPLRAGAALGTLAVLATLSTRVLPVWKNADALFQNVLRHSPNNPMALCQQAQHRIQARGDFQAADDLIDRALKVSPTLLFAIQIKAICLAHLQDVEAARTFLRQQQPHGLRSGPGVWERTLAEAAHAAKQYEEASALAEEALRLMPAFDANRHNLHLLAMAAAYEQGDQARALFHARQFPPYRQKTAVALPDLLPYYLSRWLNSWRHQAVDYFRRLLAASPDRPDLHNNVVWGLATAEWSPASPDEVLKSAQHAQTLVPAPHPGLLDTLAAAQANAGDYPAAAQTARRTLELLSPDVPEQAELRRSVQIRLREYENGRPHREEAFLRLLRSIQ